MKINPPKAVIGKEDPFEHALFGRKDFAESLTSLIRNVEESLVIFVNAPWGEGKTTFSEMWQAQLKQRNFEVIYFDAYATDYFDDPFVSFSGEILELADKKLSEGKGIIERREFKETAIEVGKKLAGLAVKVSLRAASLGAVESAHVDELKEIATGISDVGEDIIKKKIENYGVEKDALKNFKESLAKLAAKVREEQKFPLTIIVDELDRCRPDFALGLLERIKHLFDVKDVAFVLLVNRAQIESYIKIVYGNADAEAYLLKFGNLFVDLPNQEPLHSFQYIKGREEYCVRLFNHYDFTKKVQDASLLNNCSAIFAKHFSLTLREIEKAYTIMALYAGSLQNNQFITPFLVPMLSVLKIKHPDIYQLLGKGMLSKEQFFQQANINGIIPNEERLSLDWAKDILSYCLLSESEFNSLDQQARDHLTQTGMWHGRNRKNIIPSLCRQLDQFSLKPQ